MWRVEHDPHLKLLELRVRGFVASRDIDAIARAWARALAATAGDPCVALFDLRGLEPLEGAAVFIVSSSFLALRKLCGLQIYIM